MSVRLLTGLVLALFSFPAMAWASPTMTEDELLSRIDGDHPAVIAARGPLDLARAEQLGSRLLDNPVLDFGREDPSGDAALTEWMVSWQLPGADRSLSLDAAEHSVAAAAARVDHRLRSLRLLVRQDYARWALATSRHQRLDTEAARLDALASRERSRAERGESSGLEARRLELAAVTLRAKVALATSDLQEAGAAMRAWLPDLASNVRPELPNLPAIQGDDVAAGLAATHPLTDTHPLVTATRAETKAADLALRASRRFVASPLLSLGWQRQETFEQDETGPIVRLAWSLPLFDRRQSERAAAEARRDVARADASMAARHIDSRRQVAIRRLADLLTETVAAKTALDASRDMLLAAETAFRYGELPLTDLLDIQRSMTDTQLAWLELYGAALAADRELEALAPSTSFHLGDTSHPTPQLEETQP